MNVNIRACFTTQIFMAYFQVLKIMKAATNTLSAGNQPTASMILPIKASILQQIEAGFSQELVPAVRDACMAIKHDLEER